jgi:hypothetical protein
MVAHVANQWPGSCSGSKVAYTLAYSAEFTANVLWTSAGRARQLVYKCILTIHRYHTKKFQDPTFHPELYDGYKKSIFPKEQLSMIHTRMVRFLEGKPTATKQNLLEFLSKAQSQLLLLPSRNLIFLSLYLQ